MKERESAEFVRKASERDEDPRVRLAALDGLSHVEVEGWEALVIARLADKDWGVQVMSARILRERGVRKSVPHLINALSHVTLRVAEEFGAALRELTGKNFDPYADVWARWWKDHGEEFGAATDVVPVKPGEPPPEVRFYGLPVKSDRVVFVIDISGSMQYEMKPRPTAAATGEDAAPERPPDPAPAPPDGAGPADGAAPGEGEPAPAPPAEPPPGVRVGIKIDIAKGELTRAIQKLPKEASFNIIAFNHAVLTWSEGMRPATPQNKTEAAAWIAELKPSGSTYIDGALRMAFRLAGVGAADDAYPEVAVDTIVLLSDGAPTDNGFPTSENMDPEIILQHVREWNLQKRIVIHTISVDMVESVVFLQKLAEENGGKYVDI
jgi:hypothetical protein